MKATEQTYARIAAAATTLTAIAAIVIAVSDNIQTRKHDRLSVVPYLMVQLDVSSEGAERTGRITLANEGVGPAVIDSVIITLPDSSRHRTWQSVRTQFADAGLVVRGYVDFGGREAVGASRSITLLTLQADRAHPDQLFDYLSHLDVTISYHSIYGESFRASLQN